MHLAHFGTFDVKNYGDLLFPRIAEHRLSGMFSRITHVSPVGGAPYRDVSPSISIMEAVDSGMRFDGIMVGGGNIVHARPSGLSEYASVRRTAYPTLWAGAAELAKRQGIPIVMNAPGVPRRLRRPTAVAAGAALRALDYVAVRDQLSADYLAAAAVNAQVVPDSALQISDVLGTAEHLAQTFEGGEGLAPGEYVVVHINDRYSDGSPDAMAAILDEVAGELDLPMHLIAIGPCHGDEGYAREVAALMMSRPRVWDALDRIDDLAAVLANARLYVGSSLHGFITASSYGVPALLVTDVSAQHKFLGLLEQLALPQAMFASWGGFLTHLRHAGHIAEVASAPDLATARGRLDDHWDTIQRVLAGGPARQARGRYTGAWAQGLAAVNFMDEGLPAALKRRLP